MKKSLVILAIGVVSLFAFALLAQASFSDIQGYKYQAAIDFIQSRGIVKGYADGAFRPDSKINRAELLTIIVGQKYQKLVSKNCFTDVISTQWYAKFVCKGIELGIVNGYPDGSFKPERNVSFVEALIMLQRAHGIAVNTSGLIWYKDSVESASEMNIIPLDITSFHQQITRSQMAEMVTRIIKYEEKTLNDYLGTKNDYIVRFEDIQSHTNVENFWQRCQNGQITYCKNVRPTPPPAPPAPQTIKASSPTPLSLYEWRDAGGIEAFTVGIGEKISISPQLTIRIESIQQVAYSAFNGSEVLFSIWGKDNNNACRFISNTGKLYYPNSDNFQSSREFTDAFIELTGIANKAIIKKYTGYQAGQRCNQIVRSDKKPIACSFYPDDASFYVENNNFRVHFRDALYQWNAEFTAQALNQCLNVMRGELPILNNVTPYKSKWDVYSVMDPNTPSTASTDYERISLPYTVTFAPKSQFTEQDISRLDGGRCPIEFSYLPHELTHLVFNNTVLQRGYDAISRTLSQETSADPIDLDEGHAEYFPYFVTRNYLNKPSNTSPSQCGRDSLVDTHTSATADQLKYSTILKGKGFDAESRYNAGFCFFNRVQNDCGENTIKDVFTKIVMDAGSTTIHKTMFSYMGETCNHDTVKAIMNDFGFDQSLMTSGQKYPQNGFQSGDTTPGCK